MIRQPQRTTPYPYTTHFRSSPGVLTNDDIIKLVQAKLPDSVVIAKNKSSSIDVVTCTDDLINMKQPGASEYALHTILDATTPPNNEATSPEQPAAPAAAAGT